MISRPLSFSRNGKRATGFSYCVCLCVWVAGDLRLFWYKSWRNVHRYSNLCVQESVRRGSDRQRWGKCSQLWNHILDRLKGIFLCSFQLVQVLSPWHVPPCVRFLSVSACALFETWGTQFYCKWKLWSVIQLQCRS